jgi:hypothetical protein
MVVFVVWELFAPLKDPFIPLHLFRNAGYNSVVGIVASKEADPCLAYSLLTRS